MAQKDGKYLIVKDPNKPMIRFGLLYTHLIWCLPLFAFAMIINYLGDFRLYDIPDSTFESEEETDESEEGRFKVATSRGVCIMNMVWAVIHRGCMFSKEKEKRTVSSM